MPGLQWAVSTAVHGMPTSLELYCSLQAVMPVQVPQQSVSTLPRLVLHHPKHQEEPETETDSVQHILL